MKQYKMIIKENFSDNLSGIVNSEAKGGWRLNSYESSKNSTGGNNRANDRQRVVIVFEK